MTYLPPSEPMTRRERRLLEEQAAARVSEPPVVSPEAPAAVQVPEVVQPVTPAPAPLSRRERRALEEPGRDVDQSVVASPVTGPSPASQPVSTPIAVSGGAPLPPVFGAPAQAHTGSQPVFTAPPAEAARIAPHPLDTAPTPAPTLSRTVGEVSTATSSLILPGTPLVDMTSPLSSTGEVVITGQITLPPRMAEQGSAPILDHSGDNDEVMDAYVTGELAAMSKPVRASQAVSGKGDDTDILLVRKARWGTATIVTALVAAVLGLAAVGLLLLAVMTDVMG